ncbi:MAG: hypothetical protein OJF50_001511 [Nitrospira sp.]|nr:hypothetical protein [Nitrospira sp.]
MTLALFEKAPPSEEDGAFLCSSRLLSSRRDLEDLVTDDRAPLRSIGSLRP